MDDQKLQEAASVLGEVARIKSAGDRLANAEITAEDLSLDNAKVRINTRRNGRMQLRFNLTKDEAQGFSNFMTMMKPEGMTDEVFVKSMFLNGCRSAQEELAGLVRKYAEANPEELDELGVEVVEGDDGQVQVVETQKTEE